MLHHAPSAAKPVKPTNNFHGTKSFIDEPVTCAGPEAVGTTDVEPPITSGIVVGLEMITNAELEIVVWEPVKPGKLLVGTSTELGSTSSNVLGSVELVERLDMVLDAAALDDDACEDDDADVRVEDDVVDV